MTTDTLTRSNTGGFEDRFRVTRIDGKPIDPARHYLVLAYDGSDPEAPLAIQFYAYLKSRINPKLAEDLMQAVQNPSAFPAQHD
jgi:hypothetical protein